jgi:HAD superfamily hydrolase (TIGR01509 family)
MAAPTGFPLLVIFDMDGVLVDSERVSNRLLAALLSDIGLPTTPREAMDIYMGSTVAGCASLIEENLGAPIPANFMEDFFAARMRALRRDIAPIPGIEAVLDELSARGVASCVASSNSHHIIADSLAWAGLSRRFATGPCGAPRIFSATDDVVRPKPHPDVFHHAADTLGFDRSACVVVEDSPRGAAGGVAAGMPTFGFARDVAAERLRAVGALPFAEMSDLPELLAALPHRA